LQFTQTNPSDTLSAIQSGSSTTLSTAGNPAPDGGPDSIAVTITNLNGTPMVNIPAFETFESVKSSAPATAAGGFVDQTFSGKIVFSSGTNGTGFNFLTATFTDAVFFGFGSSPTLQSGSTVTFTSAVITALSMPGFSLSFSGVTPAVTTKGSGPSSTLASFKGQQTGTFSTMAVPEPSTFVLGATPLVIGVLVSRKRKVK
jgi:hypothetical protein